MIAQQHKHAEEAVVLFSLLLHTLGQLMGGGYSLRKFSC